MQFEDWVHLFHYAHMEFVVDFIDYEFARMGDTIWHASQFAPIVVDPNPLGQHYADASTNHMPRYFVLN